MSQVTHEERRRLGLPPIDPKGIPSTAAPGMARQTVCVTYGAEASAYVAIACDIAAGIVTGKAAVQAAAKKAAQEAAEQAWKAIPKAEKAIIGNVLKGKLPREAFDKLSESTKKAAIERFKQTAANPSGSMGDAASKLNQARVDFLEGRLANPPGGIGNF